MIFVLVILSISALGLLIYIALYFFFQEEATSSPHVQLPEGQVQAVYPGQPVMPLTAAKFELTDELFEKLEHALCREALIEKAKVDLDEEGCLKVCLLPDFEALRAWWEAQGNAWISLDDMMAYTQDENHIMLLNRFPQFSEKYRSLLMQVNRSMAVSTPIMHFCLLSRIQWMREMGEPLPALYS